MRSTSFLLFFGFAFLFLSCQKEVFNLNDEVSVGFNTSILVETNGNGLLDVRYTELLDESRCPPNATCVWAGFVKVKLQLNEGQYIELGLGENTVDSVVYNNQVIKLLSVNYDSNNDFGDEKKSSVVISVS